jgi:hypothetical protein
MDPIADGEAPVTHLSRGVCLQAADQILQRHLLADESWEMVNGDDPGSTDDSGDVDCRSFGFGTESAPAEPNIRLGLHLNFRVDLRVPRSSR